MLTLSEQLDILQMSIQSAPAECWLGFSILALLLLEVLFPRLSKGKAVAWIGLCIYLVNLGLLVLSASREPTGLLFLNMIQADEASLYYRGLATIGCCLTALLLLVTPRQPTDSLLTTQCFALLTALLLGTHVMSMSVHFGLMFLAVELVSLSSYVLTALSPSANNREAAIKYLLFGALSSGLMLYGISWLYGFTRTLYLYTPDFQDSFPRVPEVARLVVTLLVLGGIFFKISAVPFHLWTPDVYQSAPTPLVACLSVVPKAGAFLLLSRVLTTLQLPEAAWGVIILLTLTVGNFSALWQGDAKRLLAYSAIAHTGFMLMGVAAGQTLGWQGVGFYWAIYLLMNFGAFALVDMVEQVHSQSKLSIFSGLGLSQPLLGALMGILMVSLTGLPPTAGFSAKLILFSAVWNWYQESGSYWVLTLFIVGLVQVVVALCYYLRMPYLLFFKEPPQQRPFVWTGPQKLLVLTLVLPLLWFFFRTGSLMEWIGRFVY
jgi:NADH-quinone oxidoreductase subunit N